ncbi:hypothetical protein Ocin01_10318 [Orchesella cincta]|uniref:Uncharacterized protein n=1 Tax=Orchesella cincta TaxID=48709 RepID=A0A1D2MTJ0_ORCCI|nr:hypothetical protein Ocin01_10318 [Orchesella cincta]
MNSGRDLKRKQDGSGGHDDSFHPPSECKIQKADVQPPVPNRSLEYNRRRIDILVYLKFTSETLRDLLITFKDGYRMNGIHWRNYVSQLTFLIFSQGTLSASTSMNSLKTMLIINGQKDEITEKIDGVGQKIEMSLKIRADAVQALLEMPAKRDDDDVSEDLLKMETDHRMVALCSDVNKVAELKAEWIALEGQMSGCVRLLDVLCRETALQQRA